MKLADELCMGELLAWQPLIISNQPFVFFFMMFHDVYKDVYLPWTLAIISNIAHTGACLYVYVL